MRKVMFLVSALLLATASLAFAQATVKAGDIDLQFLGQVTTDFELRDNYDFNDAVAHITGDLRNGTFVETEARLGMNAKAGNWRIHILLEQEDRWDRDNEGGGSARLGLERAWGEYNFGAFTLRAGPSELFALDPAALVYSDDDPMVRAYGKAANVAWQAGWIRRQDDGAAGTPTTRSRDHDILHASATFPVKNGGLNLDITPFVLYNHDKQTGPTLSTTYLGAAAKGTIGPLAVLGEFAYLTGKDKTGVNTSTGVEADVSAWAAFLSLAYPIPNSPLTVEVGAAWFSGDDNGTDTDAEGFTGVAHDTENLNPDGIWLDDDIRVLATGTATVIRVKEDDRYITTLNPFTDAATTTTGSSEHANLSNPGIQFYGVLLHYKATPELTVSGIFNHIRLMEGVTDVGTTTVDITDKDIGNELAIRAVWKPEKYVSITPQISYFMPGGALEQLVGKDDPAFNAIVEVAIAF